MPDYSIEVEDKSGFQLPTGQSMTQYTIETLQSFVCIIADRHTYELDWGFLKGISNVLDSLIVCTDNYNRLAQEAIQDVDGKLIQLLISFNKVRFGDNHFIDWDESRVSATITDLINSSPLLSELKKIYNKAYESEIWDDAGLSNFTPIPEDIVLVNIEDVAETFFEVRKGLIQAYPVLNPQTKSNEQEKTVTKSSILNDPEIKEIFDELVKKKYVIQEGGYYRWLSDNALLAYLCERIYNIFLDMTKGKKKWGFFKDTFIVKGVKGNDIIPDGAKLNRYKTDWYQSRMLDAAAPFTPDGYNRIDQILIKFC